jgi:hypothetical protein
VNEQLRKLLEEVKAQEQYCKELEDETVQHRGKIDADLLERYLKSRLTAAKQYALLLDRNLQGEPSYG